MVSYKIYENFNFNISDGPIEIDLSNDIDGERHGAVIECNAGKISIQLLFDENEGYGDFETYVTSKAKNISNIRKIRLIAEVDNSAYTIEGGLFVQNLSVPTSLVGKVTGNGAEVDNDGNLCVKTAGLIVIDEPVNESTSFSTSRNKINYIVPANKQLKITGMTATNFEGKMEIEFQSDGNHIFTVGLSEDGNTFGSISVDPQTSFGPFPSGTLIRARRETGDRGKDWSAAFVGYLEDE